MSATVACAIGKHKLCTGTGVAETGEAVKCTCICHDKNDEPVIPQPAELPPRGPGVLPEDDDGETT